MKFAYSLMLVFALFATGCASVPPQQPISLVPETVSYNGIRVAYSFDKVKNPSLSYSGAACLLCLATAATANSKLSAHVKTLSVEDLSSLEAEIKSLFENAGAEIVEVSDWRK